MSTGNFFLKDSVNSHNYFPLDKKAPHIFKVIFLLNKDAANSETFAFYIKAMIVSQLISSREYPLSELG